MAEEKNAVETAKPKKEKTPKAQKEKGKIAKFFADLKSERKKITWYSKKDTMKSSALVIGVLVVFAAVIFGVDWCFANLIALLAKLG
ncbi:MAG: preprotein translocase subunit SecE [Clostridia bacterium]|nr:preprotein translocase subunit SecE [Clostridia bacterium]